MPYLLWLLLAPVAPRRMALFVEAGGSFALSGTRLKKHVWFSDFFRLNSAQSPSSDFFPLFPSSNAAGDRPRGSVLPSRFVFVPEDLLVRVRGGCFSSLSPSFLSTRRFQFLCFLVLSGGFGFLAFGFIQAPYSSMKRLLEFMLSIGLLFVGPIPPPSSPRDS